AVYGRDADCRQKLIECAEAALYAAKSRGRNQVLTYSRILASGRKKVSKRMAITRFRNRKDPAATGNSLRTHLAEAETRRHPSPKSYPWAVIHACELARDVLPLVEGQLAAGMRPSLLTPNGTIGTAGFFKTGKREQARSISLLETWGHVREWKN